ncbi:MAG: tRNA (guanosine(37)-N1)-methyltransferase TrmD [Mycoplasmataceae bacterium]|nr:tRNA (guanosine(37)-N1)-methyltransferase TrmD [Mycoplasmataceae bacterium]
MKITILTLFPNLFENFLNESIVKRTISKKIVSINIVNFRDFSNDKKHQRVDDYQYGGGAGMIIKLQPIVDAIKKYRTKKTKVILLSPQGEKFTQKKANFLSQENDLIIICGRYEGFDERIINYVDEIISIGDYILMGGEIPAMVIIESVIRLIDNTINKKSLESETFTDNLLDYPVYTKPIIFDGYAVPKVLLSGNHEEIKKYRANERIIKTKKNRVDLYNLYIDTQKNVRTKKK